MGNRQQIQEIPDALRLTLEKARAEFGAVVRKVRWGDGPVYVCGAGACAALGPAATYAFESLLGWPVVARPVEIFQTYALSLLRPRAVLVMICAAGEWPEAHELARAARQRGCTLVALTNEPESSVGKLADHVLLVRADGDAESPDVAVCLYAALNMLALQTAFTLKRPEPQRDMLGKELDQLAEKIEWVFAQLRTVVRSMSHELAHLKRLSIVAGGFYYYPAWRAARRMRLGSLTVEAMEGSEFSPAQHVKPEDGVLFLSGSHSAIKKVMHRCAQRARTQGAHVFSLTDSNDRELVEHSNMAVLVPAMLELPGSILSMSTLEWLVVEAASARGLREQATKPK